MAWNNYTGNYLLTLQLQYYEFCLIVITRGTESQTYELQLSTLNVNVLLSIHSQISRYKERNKLLTLKDEF